MGKRGKGKRNVRKQQVKSDRLLTTDCGCCCDCVVVVVVLGCVKELQHFSLHSGVRSSNNKDLLNKSSFLLLDARRQRVIMAITECII